MQFRCPTLTIAILLSAVSLCAQPSGPAGHWEGKIQVSDRELSLVVDLAKNAAGVWIGSMTIPGSTTVDVPLSTVTVDGLAIGFTASLPAKTLFEGKVSADAKGLSGTASSLMGSAPFQLTRTGDADVKVPPPSSALSKAFEGTWEGSLDVRGEVKRIVLKLWPAADGTATATLTDATKGQEFPVTTVTISGQELELDLRVISGKYRGTLSAGGEIAGEWTQGTARLPLTFTRAPSEGK